MSTNIKGRRWHLGNRELLMGLRYHVCFQEDSRFVRKESESELKGPYRVFRRIQKTSRSVDWGSLLPHLSKACSPLLPCLSTSYADSPVLAVFDSGLNKRKVLCIDIYALIYLTRIPKSGQKLLTKVMLGNRRQPK